MFFCFSFFINYSCFCFLRTATKWLFVSCSFSEEPLLSNLFPFLKGRISERKGYGDESYFIEIIFNLCLIHWGLVGFLPPCTRYASAHFVFFFHSAFMHFSDDFLFQFTWLQTVFLYIGYGNFELKSIHIGCSIDPFPRLLCQRQVPRMF